MTGSRGTSTNPVTNVPASAPAVAQAESRPNTVPLEPRSRSWSLARVGVTALSTAAAGSSAANVSTSAPASPPPRSDGPEQAHDRHDQQRQHAAAGEQPGKQPARVDQVGGAAAQRRARGDPGQHRADDGRGGLERQADVGRQQADAQDLQHQHGAGGQEGQRRGRLAGQRPRGCPRRSGRVPLGGAGLGLGRLDLAVLRRCAGDQLAQQLTRDRGDLLDGVVERLGVGLRRLGRRR